MYRDELLNRMRQCYSVKQYHVNKKQCNAALQAFEKVVTNALLNDERIVLRGFLTIEARDVKAREGYNPITKQKEQFAASKKVYCRVGKNIVKKVNNKFRKTEKPE